MKIASYRSHCSDGDCEGQAFELYASMDRIEQLDQTAKMRVERWSDGSIGRRFERTFLRLMRLDNPPRGPYRSAPR